MSAVARKSNYFTEAQIQRALTEVAACSGNTHMAERNLAADGFSVAQRTLWKWSRRMYVGDYERIRTEILPAITKAAAEQHLALARRQMEGAALLADELIAERDQLEPRDRINALGKLDIGSGIHSEKAQLLAGNPTQIVENNLGDLKRALAQRGVSVVIEGTAVEEPLAVDTEGVSVTASDSRALS